MTPQPEWNYKLIPRDDTELYTVLVYKNDALEKTFHNCAFEEAVQKVATWRIEQRRKVQ